MRGTNYIRYSLLGLLGASMVACAQIRGGVVATAAGGAKGQPPSLHGSQLTQEQKRAIAMRIWKNECAGTVKGLVSWNAGEAFPSLGIGHFIWYPRGVQGAFEESFPAFVRYVRSRSIPVPAWTAGVAPWQNKQEFQRTDVQGGLPDQVRDWLSKNIDLQIDFIIARSQAALQKMLQVSRHPQLVAQNFRTLASTPQGMYCLIDYVNFKGEGILATERYREQGWGLMQVLEAMQPSNLLTEEKAPAVFAQAAKAVLARRVNNSPPERGERRWLEGWHNRCNTYR